MRNKDTEPINIRVIVPSETFLFSPWQHNYYFMELLRGIIAAATISECEVTILHRGLHKEKRYIELFGKEGIDGLIIPAAVLEKEDIGEIRASGKKVILINSRHPELNYVDADNKEGACRVVEYLIEEGHRRIGIITGSIETKNAKERVEGYKAALRTIPQPKKDYIRYGNFSTDSGHSEMLELLKLPLPPTAVFCSNDLMALGAMRAIKEKKLVVPDDISIVGFDDLVVSEYFDPPLSTVRQPLFHIGKEALTTLVSIINGEKPEPQRAIIKTRLIKRESVSKPAQQFFGL